MIVLRRVIGGLVVGLALAMVTGTAARAQDSVQPATTLDGKRVESLAEKMRNDPALMDLVTSLQSDPDFEKVMEDPDVQAALQSGNTEVLLANPKINSLVNNPTVQEITKKLPQ